MKLTDLPARYFSSEEAQAHSAKLSLSDAEIMAAMPGTINEIAGRVPISRSRVYIRVRMMLTFGSVHISGTRAPRPHGRPVPIYAASEVGKPSPSAIPQRDPLMAALFGSRK